MKIDYKQEFEKEYSDKLKNGDNGWNNDDIILSQFEIVKESLKRNNLLSKNILELGCGDGKLAILLAKEGFNVTGIDISKTAIDWAMKRSESIITPIDFRVADVLNLPFKKNNFDLVIDSFCLHCIIGNDRNDFFSEVKRVLKDEGLLLVMTKTGTPTFNNMQRTFDQEQRISYINGKPSRYWGTKEILINEIQQSGFSIKWYEIKHYNYEVNTGLFIADAYKLK
ncbi:MAG: class I SAM-dependent methyltransferase [bacterium]